MTTTDLRADRIERLANVIREAIPRLSMAEGTEAVEAIRHYLRTNPEDGPWSIMYASEAYSEFAKKPLGSRVMTFNHQMPTLVIKDPHPASEPEEEVLSLEGVEVVEYVYGKNGLHAVNGNGRAAYGSPAPYVPAPPKVRKAYEPRPSNYVSLQGDVIRARRINMNISQRELGELSGIPSVKISALEIGRTRAKREEASKLAEVLNIDPALLTAQEPPADLAELFPAPEQPRKVLRGESAGPRFRGYFAVRPKVITVARTNMGISQTRLGVLAGIPQTKVSGLERGKTTINEEQLARLATTLNIEPAWILRDENAADPDALPEGLVPIEPIIKEPKVRRGPRSQTYIRLHPGIVEDARKTLELTQKGLAQSAGISTGTMWQIERFNNPVTPKQLEGLAAALGMDPEELRMFPEATSTDSEDSKPPEKKRNWLAWLNT